MPNSYPKGVTETNFHFIRHESEPWTLIVPIHQAVEWHKPMLWYRSRIEHDDGRIVSMGFPKFFNLGERQTDQALVKSACENKEPVYYSDKRDGSLLIRSVFDGQLIVRTRGSFSVGLDEVCQRQIKECAPKNFYDPQYGEGISFLYEFTSPDNSIVVPYEKPALTLIGAVDHRYEPRIMTTQEFLHEASCLGPSATNPEVSRFFNSIEDLIAWVNNQITLYPEGVVLRVGSQLVKLKNSDYLNKHRLKYYMKDKELRYICIQNNLQTSEQFAELPSMLQVDWEIAQVLEERYQQYVAEIEQLLRQFQKARQLAGKAKTKKQAAATYKGHKLFNLIMSIMDGSPKKAHKWVLRQLGLPLHTNVGAECRFTDEISDRLTQMGFEI